MSDEVEKPDEGDQIDPYALFSERIRLDVYGLAFVGHLQKEVEFCGHSFVLRTLRPIEKASIAVAIQEYRDTLAEPEAWANGHVAMALVSVDGHEDFCPQAGPDIHSYARARLRYLTNENTGWYPPTLMYLYDQYLDLEKEALAAVEELRNLSVGSPTRSEFSLDSLPPQDTSDAPTDGDTQS